MTDIVSQVSNALYEHQSVPELKLPRDEHDCCADYLYQEGLLKRDTSEIVDQSNDNFVHISGDRLFHMYGVAHRAMELSVKLFDYSESDAREMFVLGLLHDVGYEFCEDNKDHALVGHEIVKRTGFKHAVAIRDHGDPSLLSTMTDVDLILNIADMQVDETGRRVSCEERIESIRTRYGANSREASSAEVLFERMKDELNKRSINLSDAFDM